MSEIEKVTENPIAHATWIPGARCLFGVPSAGWVCANSWGQLVDQVLGLIQQGKSGEIQALFDQYADAPDFFKMFMQIVVDILNGSRDKTLADNSELM